MHDGKVGHSGPIHVSYPTKFSASHHLWHQTLNSAGVESNDDHLGGCNTGCWTSVVSVDPQTVTRSYAATAYYQPIADRPNLLVLTGAEVREILLAAPETSTAATRWQARGVRFAHKGSLFTAFASREVIVSAGSIQSPQLLELSGIGDERVLSAAGIPLKVKNPNVGENLQDHLSRSKFIILSLYTECLSVRFVMATPNYHQQQQLCSKSTRTCPTPMTWRSSL